MGVVEVINELLGEQQQLPWLLWSAHLIVSTQTVFLAYGSKADSKCKGFFPIILYRFWKVLVERLHVSPKKRHVPCTMQDTKWQAPKVWWGEYAECKCNLSIQKQKSEIGQQSYYWKNLIKSSSFQRLKSVWKCRPKQRLQREGEWEFFFANPEQRPFQELLARCANNSDFIFATWNWVEHRKRHSVITTSLLVCLIVLEFKTWTTTHLQIQVQLAA